MDLTKFNEMQSMTTVEQSNQDGVIVITSPQFDPDTGAQIDVVSTQISVVDIQAQIDELQSKIDSLNALLGTPQASLAVAAVSANQQVV